MNLVNMKTAKKASKRENGSDRQRIKYYDPRADVDLFPDSSLVDSIDSCSTEK